MTERELREQDERLDALVEEAIHTATRYGAAKERHGYGDEVALASDAMQAARDALQEYMDQLRTPRTTVTAAGDIGWVPTGKE